jgi:hypothetical protein
MAGSFALEVAAMAAQVAEQIAPLHLIKRRGSIQPCLVRFNPLFDGFFFPSAGESYAVLPIA